MLFFNTKNLCMGGKGLEKFNFCQVDNFFKPFPDKNNRPILRNIQVGKSECLMIIYIYAKVSTN
ncbi:hypothetical protein BTHERMOSOX_340 [Bathymodiolus thermophilus thioautotrophic gill symbiont]|nr:hypothetical protein BTHERMOSOX_340 [Bathymodiolus thermophilus thioautotrophic gill symbiont]